MEQVPDPPGTSPPEVDVMDVSPANLNDAVSPTTLNDGENDDRIPKSTSLPPVHLQPSLRPNPTAETPNLHPSPFPDSAATGRVPPVVHGPHPAPPNPIAIPPEAKPSATHFVYVLRRYKTIQEIKVHSPWHVFDGYKWRLLIFPRGNQPNSHELSVYLECGGPVNRSEQPHYAHQNAKGPNGKEAAMTPMTPVTWSRPAKFSLLLLHPSSPIAKKSVRTPPDRERALSGLDGVESNSSNVSSLKSMGRSPTGVSAIQKPDITKETSHNFKENASDWGFLEFAPFNVLEPTQYADDDMNVVIMVRIRLVDNTESNMFNSTQNTDSRKSTGFVGFKNQGATCYMNSLLQTLYMVSAFRKAVYSMPLPHSGNDNSGSELSYALQKVFYELQTCPTVVKTKQLTESFGWDTTDAFTQHDVQELKLMLCDELAEKMKKIAPNKPNTLATLFEGKLLNYIECVNVEYKSTREELFTDLSVNVKGCRNIYESFDKYIEVEMMDGDNKYRADGHEELQDARKGVKFLSLPPVLQLHLKRFEYDFHRNAMVKINDRYEFESELDLGRYVEGSDGNDIYVLHSVLVHIGDVNGGHYHVFIRPNMNMMDTDPKKASQWYMFDDEIVTKVTDEAAIQDNFGVGGERDSSLRRGIDDDISTTGMNGIQTHPPSVMHPRTRNYQNRRFSNAYMLQYLRKSDIPSLLKAPAQSDVPKELAQRITKEVEEEQQRLRDMAEQHLYMNVAVATNNDMVDYHGSDLVQWDKVHQLHVKRALQLGELKQRLQKEKIVRDAGQMRLWKCSIRHNDTTRPDSLVANGNDSHPITDANARDPLTQSVYNVGLHPGRHGFYGQEQVVRMYAEDFTSPFCLGAGQAYSEHMKRLREVNTDRLNTTEIVNNSPWTTEMETGSNRPPNTVQWPNFPLVHGKEVLLFAKYYCPTPSPRLQWLGHFVVDRSMPVRDVHPLLRQALESFRRRDASLRDLDEGAGIVVFEEESAEKIAHLNENKSLADHRIPYDTGSGDILVFQQKGKIRRKESEPVLMHDVEWDGYQEPSRGDLTDRPLGGRPLPTVNHYFEYLAYRVKIEFKDKNSIGSAQYPTSKFFEMLRKDSYYTARKVLAGELGKDVDPDYLRFFAHDLTRGTAAQEPLLLRRNEELRKVLPMHSMENVVAQPEHKILWYERTEYHISEFDSKDEVRVVWRQDGGARATPYSSVADTSNARVISDNIIRADVSLSIAGEGHGRLRKTATKPNGQHSPIVIPPDQSKSFSVLVPMSAKYIDVMDQVRSKLKIPAEVRIRMCEVKQSKIFRIIDPSDPLPPLMTGNHDCVAELRAEPVPEDETEDALGSEYELMTVLHLPKDKPSRQWKALTFFGVPFVIKVRKEGETVNAIRKRIQEKLGVPQEVFDQWPLAEVVQLKVHYLDEEDDIYHPHAREPMGFCSLAIEHKSTAPVKKVTSVMSRYADKPLKIRS
ncbi:unnamed protein product [Chondrus crispus]|uniref:ubiquitinyl hydrolase 1 n=1 Tax=Chondrus crispus TaxID=2769 RepID=R7QS38_CHOCR|nr:unnamed protein product [Chondrus crispus]CDF40331.1 unnamed protein product [Chondrus crispus]|eukprot:XP_005710625.1 unnamed protein product [Chondrus crispus]